MTAIRSRNSVEFMFVIFNINFYFYYFKNQLKIKIFEIKSIK